MKKVKLLLLSMICYGIVNAQADTSAHKTNPLKADTIVKSSDSVFISADTIAIGNMIIVKGQQNQVNSKIKKGTFFSTNKDSMFLNFPSVEKAEGTIAFIKPDNAKSDLIFPFTSKNGQSVALNIKDLQRGAWAIEVEWKSDTVNVLSRFKLTL